MKQDRTSKQVMEQFYQSLIKKKPVLWEKFSKNLTIWIIQTQKKILQMIWF